MPQVAVVTTSAPGAHVAAVALEHVAGVGHERAQRVAALDVASVLAAAVDHQRALGDPRLAQ